MSNRNTIPSARLIRNGLQEKLGFKILLTSDPEKIKGVLHVRYGNFYEVNGNVRDISPNSRKFIDLLSNKLRFSNFLSARGFKCPEFSKETPTNEDYPIIVRETLSGYGGVGITVVKSEEEYTNNLRRFYWTKFIQMSNEYRVHILNGKVAKVFKKIRDDGLDQEEFPIRNSQRGYRFSLRESKPDRFAKLDSTIDSFTEAMEEIDIKWGFCGLDVGYAPSLDDYFIIEGNSAPGITEATCSLYVEAIYNNLKG